MTINLQTLKCAECGSGQLERTGLNQYVCAHCGSVSVVEDNVSERLDRVLDQVKDAAAARLAAEHARRRPSLGPGQIVGIVVGGLLITGLVTQLVWKQAFQRDARGAGTPSASVVASADRSIPASSLRLEPGREVLVGSGSSARPKLLVMVRNDSDTPLERPTLKATFFDGTNRLAEHSESAPIGMLAPGESAPVLIDMPSGPGVTRHDIAVQRLAAPYRSVEAPRLTFQRVRLVQQKDDLRLVGRIANTRKDGALAGCEVLVTLYDARGAVVGLGRGYARANEIGPGERSDMDVRLERFGTAAPVAAWDYRINYQLAGDGNGGRTQAVARERVVRSDSAPEVFHPDLRMGSADLLADESERFDSAQLEFAPLVAGRGTTQRPLYLTELVNRSRDAIVLAPGAVIARYDGNQLDGSTSLQGPAYLYPGERFPVLLEPRQANRITATRVEWKPVQRRAALPGPRTPLEIEVTGTRADTSSVLVNFSQRFTYKFARVSGSVKNPGNAIVRKARVWVSLRDREGKLTGFSLVDNLPAIGPGESVPFEVKVDQFGRDFASVSTVYQSE